MNLRARIQRLETRLTRVEDCEESRKLLAEDRWRRQFLSASRMLVCDLWTRLGEPERAAAISDDNVPENWQEGWTRLTPEDRQQYREAARELYRRELERQQKDLHDRPRRRSKTSTLTA